MLPYHFLLALIVTLTQNKVVSPNYKYITSQSIAIDTSFYNANTSETWDNLTYSIAHPQHIALKGKPELAMTIEDINVKHKEKRIEFYFQSIESNLSILTFKMVSSMTSHFQKLKYKIIYISKEYLQGQNNNFFTLISFSKFVNKYE